MGQHPHEQHLHLHTAQSSHAPDAEGGTPSPSSTNYYILKRYKVLTWALVITAATQTRAPCPWCRGWHPLSRWGNIYHVLFRLLYHWFRLLYHWFNAGHLETTEIFRGFLIWKYTALWDKCLWLCKQHLLLTLPTTVFTVVYSLPRYVIQNFLATLACVNFSLYRNLQNFREQSKPHIKDQADSGAVKFKSDITKLRNVIVLSS